MPFNPLELLKRGFNAATTPLISREAVGAGVDEGALDAPALNRSPWEARLRGFGAGVLGAGADMTSPAELGLNVAGGAALGALGRGAGRGLGALRAAAPALERSAAFGDDAVRMGRQAFDVVEDAPVNQINPGMDDINALIGDLQRNLAKVPSKGAGGPSGIVPPRPPVTPNQLGGRMAEFTPQGGEAVYNAGRQVADPRTNTDLYMQLMQRFGGLAR